MDEILTGARGPEPGSEPLLRNLRPDDLDAMVRIDARIVGRRRDEFFRLKLKQAFADSGIAVSLAADIDHRLVGFLLARVYFGEFGVTERVAAMDVFGVHPDFRGRGVGAALIDQLRVNLLALGINTVQTEVAWDSQDLLSFFHRQGFRLAPRLCLDLDLEQTRR
jgi:ribosomal protein S18 acetylase RimI-like enzyme